MASLYQVKPCKDYDICFELSVNKTRKGMLNSIKNHDKKHGKPVDYSNEIIKGMFVVYDQFVNDKIPGTLVSSVLGTMFLNLEDADLEIISHECSHATFAWELYLKRYTGNFDDDDFKEQESFCYFLGKSVKEVCKILKKNYNYKLKI